MLEILCIVLIFKVFMLFDMVQNCNKSRYQYCTQPNQIYPPKRDLPVMMILVLFFLLQTTNLSSWWTWTWTWTKYMFQQDNRNRILLRPFSLLNKYTSRDFVVVREIYIRMPDVCVCMRVCACVFVYVVVLFKNGLSHFHSKLKFYFSN